MKLYKHWFFVFITIMMFSCNHLDKSSYPLHEKKVLILGNSITQKGDYVSFIEYYLRKNYPEKKLDIISIGLSSETVSGNSELNRPFPRPNIHARLNNALNKIKPDLVIACYGMNDGIFSDKDSLRFMAYRQGIYDLKEKVEKQGADLILLTPTPFDPYPIKDRISTDSNNYEYQHPYYSYNNVLEEYANWLLSLEDKKIQVINLHSYLNDRLSEIKKHDVDSTFIPDGVHPDLIGHFHMAKKVLNDLYPEISINDPISEIEKLKNDSLFFFVSERREIRSDGWLNYIGYTKGKVVKSNNITSTQDQVIALDKKIHKTLKEQK